MIARAGYPSGAGETLDCGDGRKPCLYFKSTGEEKTIRERRERVGRRERSWEGRISGMTRAVNEFRFDRVSFRFVVTKWLTKRIFVSFY
jgi:hypothetical protein